MRTYIAPIHRWTAPFILGAILLSAPGANGATWDGGPAGTGTSWNDPTNWSGDVIPPATDTVAFTNIGTGTGSKIISLDASQTIYQLSINPFSNVPSFTIGSAADVTANNILSLTNVFRGDNNSCLIGLLPILFLLLIGPGPIQAAGPAGSSRIAQWKDDRTAVFMLMFDDGWPSHFQVAVPELIKRDLIATFYICPDKGEFKKMAKEWDKVAATKMVLADHTMTHGGVKDLANAEYEIGECATIIRQLQPGKVNRLVSFGMPGVGPGAWNISSEQLNELLLKHHLVSRPPFAGHGAVYHQKTLEEMVALADKAIREKGIEYLVVHGVERVTPNWGFQDMWALKQTIFFPLLDALVERRDRGELWITDHISVHQYETERATAEVKVLLNKPNGIQLELKSQADPVFYDFPLTIITQVPPSWTKCNISQGGKPTIGSATKGELKFEALPNAGPINIWPAPAS